jgi:hypothetical protein
MQNAAAGQSVLNEEDVFTAMKSLSLAPGRLTLDKATEAKLRNASKFVTSIFLASGPHPDGTKLDAEEERLVQSYLRLAQSMGTAIGLVAKLPASKYEDLFVANGCNQIVARGVANHAIRHAKLKFQERETTSEVIKAIRSLGRSNRRSKKTTKEIAARLLTAWTETFIIENIFWQANSNEAEFIKLLRSIVAGEEYSKPRIAEIVAELTPHLSVSRGPKMSLETITHQFVLEILGELDNPHGYTLDGITGLFTDPRTEATRIVFNNPTFDPRIAHRRIRRGKTWIRDQF